ncbi:phage antirepressor [Jeotgalibacillus campisalis]|uniref:Antirepressor n=1 Tax=Jeotgalibacillus campisalis TaxID=220754 RepID=A0A0C2VQA2_9BACL|nr:phage antirepressor KilAC domain-containing protein [Jeotgalibacillus campisalis]KIL46193.1 antirepressor [Jeotgalibacillus campisalis]
MNQITKIFDGHQVRIIDQNDQHWFVAKDVCEVLDHSNHKVAVSRLDEDEVRKVYLTDSLNRQQLTNVVNEAGLYSLVITSTRPQAKKFKRWITHEVIPTIRKHGAYATPETLDKMLADPDNMIKILTTLKEERSAREAAEQKIEQDRPKVVLAEALEISRDSILIRELALLLKQKGVEIGEKRLFAWLREKGYLSRKVGESYNLPTQKAMNMGLFEIKKGVRSGNGGAIRQTRTSKVTGRGQIYFVNKFLGTNYKAI